MFQSVCVCAFKREYTLWVWHYCHNKEGGKYLYGLLYGPFQLYTIISNVLACATTISVLHILWQPRSAIVSLSFWEIYSEIEELQIALNCSSEYISLRNIFILETYLSQKYIYLRHIYISFRNIVNLEMQIAHNCRGAVCPSQRLWCTIGPWQPSSY